MTYWILASGLERGASEYESPVIIYDNETGETWQIRDKDRLNNAIVIEDRNSNNQSSPVNTLYTPDVTIEGNNISLDFLVWNGAGEDCASAVLNMTTSYENLNPESGSSDGPTYTSAATRAYILNLSSGESAEVRVTTEIPEPAPGKTIRFRITLRSPDAFMTDTGTLRTYDPLGLPRGDATFIIKAKDAPELVPLPTIRAG
ncbi:MAG: hypothetical protein PHD55_05305 [Methanoregula sp.]|jgi:hypothetical protein|nr:hypothetical protein [Methanoregula sp.]